MIGYLNFLWDTLPNLLIGYPGGRPGGLILSMLLAVAAVALGFLIALFVSAGTDNRRLPVRWLSRLYVELFRGLPLILLLVLVHQVIGGHRFGLDFSPLTSGFVALTLYTSAYQTEILRAGLLNVPDELLETARLMGSSPRQLLLWVKLPYALRIMLPAFTGQVISLFKDTSVVTVIGVAELMTVARISLGSDVSNAPYSGGQCRQFGHPLLAGLCSCRGRPCP